jgi:indole-3-glycerol phosphate synthase
MEPLVESHSLEDLQIALDSDAKIIGVNNRDLNSFEVSFDQASSYKELLAERAKGRILVCESGVKDREDIEKMIKVGYKVFLVGESLVTSDNPEVALNLLLANSR